MNYLIELNFLKGAKDLSEVNESTSVDSANHLGLEENAIQQPVDNISKPLFFLKKRA